MYALPPWTSLSPPPPPCGTPRPTGPRRSRYWREWTSYPHPTQCLPLPMPSLPHGSQHDTHTQHTHHHRPPPVACPCPPLGQTILVPRTPKDRETLPDVVTAIKTRASSDPRYPRACQALAGPAFPHSASYTYTRCQAAPPPPFCLQPPCCCGPAAIVIFPEGTTVSQKAVIRFNKGTMFVCARTAWWHTFGGCVVVGCVHPAS